MELTIIEPDVLNSNAYEAFTPAVLVEKNKQNLNAIILSGALVIGVLILLVILDRFSEN